MAKNVASVAAAERWEKGKSSCPMKSIVGLCADSRVPGYMLRRDLDSSGQDWTRLDKEQGRHLAPLGSVGTDCARSACTIHSTADHGVTIECTVNSCCMTVDEISLLP